MVEIRKMEEIREYVAEIRDIMPPERAETVIRRLIVLKAKMNPNPALQRDIWCLIRVVNEADEEYRNMVCDIVEHTLDQIKKGRY